MIKAADHTAFVSKLRVTDRQLAPLIPFYHVRNVDSYLIAIVLIELQMALVQLKGTYSRAS
jgi:hypothetical protein